MHLSGNGCSFAIHKQSQNNEYSVIVTLLCLNSLLGDNVLKLPEYYGLSELLYRKLCTQLGKVY